VTLRTNRPNKCELKWNKLFYKVTGLKLSIQVKQSCVDLGKIGSKKGTYSKHADFEREWTVRKTDLYQTK
jgi:hypothetical protein